MKLGLALVALVAVLVTGASAIAGGNGVVASANGDYGFTGQAAGSTFVIGPFTWNVQVKADGSIEGLVQLHPGARRRRALGERHAHVRVLRGRPRVGRRGHRGELAGEPRRSRHVVPGSRLRRGRERAARHVVDARGGGRSGGQQYCDDHPPVRFPFLVERGEPAGPKRLSRAEAWAGLRSRPAHAASEASTSRGSGPASTPWCRLNERVKWLWSAKPASIAIRASGRPSTRPRRSPTRAGARARSRRRSCRTPA